MGEPPLHLRVLGSVDLRRADGSRLLSFLAQPKRVALLAYVALEAPDGFVSRERIMSVLWPDSDATRARQSLRNALYQIRQSAGAEALTNRGSVDVGVDPAVVFVDALALKTAVAEGRFEDAVALYGGPFLAGFHLDDAPEFEEWTARTRATLEAEALRAFREAASLREAAGDVEEARGLLRRAQEIAPADEEILRRRLLLLAALGNRAAAVAEGEEWVETLHATLGIDPSEPTLRLLSELRSGAPVGGAPSAIATAVQPDESAQGVAFSTPTPVTRPRRAALAWILSTAAVAVAVWFAAPRPQAQPPVEGGVIVERFEADSAAGGRTVGVAVGALSARYLDPASGGIVLPAEGVSAATLDGLNRRLITGRVRAEGDELVAEVTLATTARPGKALARASVGVEPGLVGRRARVSGHQRALVRDGAGWGVDVPAGGGRTAGLLSPSGAALGGSDEAGRGRSQSVMR